MTKIAKITDETLEDLKTIQSFIINYGKKGLPPEFQPILDSIKDNPAYYKTIIAIAVKFLRILLEEIEEKKES